MRWRRRYVRVSPSATALSTTRIAGRGRSWHRALGGQQGDSYDKALAETINGLYKAELIPRRGPWKICVAVELATFEWVAWFNHRRLRELIGYIPPEQAAAKRLPATSQSGCCDRLT